MDGWDLDPRSLAALSLKNKKEEMACIDILEN